MIKLIAIDLDGTLLDEEKKISNENKRVLAGSQSKRGQDRVMYRAPISSDGSLSARTRF